MPFPSQGRGWTCAGPSGLVGAKLPMIESPNLHPASEPDPPAAEPDTPELPPDEPMFPMPTMDDDIREGDDDYEAR